MRRVIAETKVNPRFICRILCQAPSSSLFLFSSCYFEDFIISYLPIFVLAKYRQELLKISVLLTYIFFVLSNTYLSYIKVELSNNVVLVSGG